MSLGWVLFRNTCASKKTFELWLLFHCCILASKKKATPEPSAAGGSPTCSIVSEGEGGGARDAENSVDEVLQGEDIEALRITEEDLRKVREPAK